MIAQSALVADFDHLPPPDFAILAGQRGRFGRLDDLVHRPQVGVLGRKLLSCSHSQELC